MRSMYAYNSQQVYKAGEKQEQTYMNKINTSERAMLEVF